MRGEVGSPWEESSTGFVAPSEAFGEEEDDYDEDEGDDG